MYVTLPVLLPLLDCKHFKELSINQLTKCSEHSSRTNLLKMLSQYVTLLLEMLQWLHMALGVKAKNPVMVYKVLCGLVPFTFVTYPPTTLTFAPSTPDTWHSCQITNISSILLPQGLCTDCWICLNALSPYSGLAHSLTSFKILFKCHFLNTAYLVHFI